MTRSKFRNYYASASTSAVSPHIKGNSKEEEVFGHSQREGSKRRRVVQGLLITPEIVQFIAHEERVTKSCRIMETHSTT